MDTIGVIPRLGKDATRSMRDLLICLRRLEIDLAPDVRRSIFAIIYPTTSELIDEMRALFVGVYRDCEDLHFVIKRRAECDRAVVYSDWIKVDRISTCYFRHSNVMIDACVNMTPTWMHFVCVNFDGEFHVTENAQWLHEHGWFFDGEADDASDKFYIEFVTWGQSSTHERPGLVDQVIALPSSKADNLRTG